MGAIDANTNGDFGDESTTHTNSETDPWWELDLGIRMKFTELSELDLLHKNLDQQVGSTKQEVEEYAQEMLKELNTRHPTLMALSKERLTVAPPKGAEEQMPFSLFLSRIGDSEGKERVKRAKELARINLEKELEFLKSEGEGEGE